MKLLFRPSTPADAAAIVALFVAAGAHPSPDQRHFEWKYWQPRADWPQPRSFVMASGAELMAHAAVVPGAYASGTQRVSMIHAIDWVARPGQAGAGTVLMRRLGQMAQAMILIGGSADTRRILPHLGFRPAGTAIAYARPLFPLRLLRGVTSWRLVPKLARAAWRLAAPAARGAEWQSRRLVADEVGQIASVLPVPAQGMAVTERSVDLFRYVLTCPVVPMQLYAIERAGRVRGYFLIASVPGQVRIADCWMDSVETTDWRAMILCAVEQAKRDPRAAEVVIWASDALLTAALHTCGFCARFQSPVQARVIGAGAAPAGTLRVQMLDNDSAFLYQGGTEYWG